MGDVDIRFNIPKFVRALDAYEVTSQKNSADVLNHAMRNVGYRAAQFTPTATKSRIKADLKRDPHLVYALTSIMLKRQAIGKLQAPMFAAAVKKLIARRTSSARYLRAAWAEAVQQLGGTWRGRRFKGGATGYANEATPRHLVAEMVALLREPDSGHASSAEAIGLEALEQAFIFVTADLEQYAERKMREAAAAHSG